MATVLTTAAVAIAVALAIGMVMLWRLYTDSQRRADEAARELANERRRVDEQQTALRRYEVAFASIHGRGELGERVLVETAKALGLREGLHYTLQADVAGGGAVKPDMLLHVGGGRSVPVDAKASMACWAEAVETDDEAERAEALRVHVRNLRARAAELSSRGYERYADAIYGTIMFVPSDAAVVAAMDTEPELLRWLLNRRVFMCGPTGFAVLASAALFASTERALADDVERVRAAASGAHRAAGNAIEAVNLSSTHLQRFLSARRRELDALEAFRRTVQPLSEASGSTTALSDVRRDDGEPLSA
ncbi:MULTISPECIES: DNA recombination protein RmuC [Thermocrispum]|jgi:DNA recombination protein RmuC|uniref:DNA recombination protein RmuC n=1 Tax=Thermocrispum agreste TaxID=37925 RepID=A0A2W4JKK5_9PSEU|nr:MULTISPECIES: DNA recombination protein RmuC [Thermocrispum]PZM99620.1 MAG: DNA recombination protein RmuC [Thermocrispum agreste]